MKATYYLIRILYILISGGILLLFGCDSSSNKYQASIGKLPDKVDFNFHIKPILSDRCFSCHGPDENTREANLRLDVEEAAFAVLDSVDKRFAIVPGNLEKSALIQRISSTDPDFQMPPPESNLRLSDYEIALLKKWIDQGAEWKPHWSFIPPEKTSLPLVAYTSELQNPIDHFVLAQLERIGMQFSEKADKETLIRRVSLDLTGLPSTIVEVENFVNDSSPDAFEKVVDRLLASPQFGERWAWDWLDAARYADTNGFQGDPERKMWPWREWVIKAINKNMPFDQFTVEQLAGDLIPEATSEQILATAFNRNHMYNGEGGRIPEETRVENVFDRLETTATVWMGLTMNCTRCHDHKFDPITQKEYFQFYDFFNQTSETGLNGNGMIPPLLDLSPPLAQEEVAKYQAFVDKISEQVSEYETRIFPRDSGTAAASPAAANLDGDNLFTLGFTPADRNSYYVGLLANSFKETDPDYAELLYELRKAQNQRSRQASQNLQVMVMDHIENPRPTFVLDRGGYDRPIGEPLSSNVPQVLPPLPETEVPNRLTLAKWLVDKKHPLTARVTVNRFWQAVFGTGLVKTPENFGYQGALPTHPELLDWLALDFVESGWDVKALLKKMVMSYTYQQSSKVSEELLAQDPENKWLARAPRYRLPSWMIRDQALAISGLLHDSIGGPSVKPYQPEGVWEEATFGFKTYVQDHGNALYRRTLYTFWRRIVGPTMLFDNSARQVCSVNTLLTNSPQHALTTLNDITYLEASRIMAEKVLLTKSSEYEQIEYAFRLATSRFPDQEERQILLDRIREFRREFNKNPQSAEDFLQVGEWPQNKELDKIEHAAFAALCSMILNLDETISKQ